MHRILLVFALPLLFSVVTWERLDLRHDHSLPAIYRTPLAEHSLQIASTPPHRLDIVHGNDEPSHEPEPDEWFGYSGVLIATSISITPLMLSIFESPGFVH